MNPYELLIQDHAVPLLEEGETIESKARVYTGGFSQRFYVAAATRRRIILIEMKSNLLSIKTEFAGIRLVPYRDIERLATWSFLTLKHIVVGLRSGETFTISLNNLSARIPGQELFVSTVKTLYSRYQSEESDATLSEGTPSGQDMPGIGYRDGQPAGGSNARRGVLAGLLGTLLAAALWASIAIVGEAPIRWMTLGVGLLVGASVRIGASGADRKLALTAGVLAVVGCALGTFIWAAYFFARGGEPLQRLLRLLTVPTVTREVVSLAYDPSSVILYSIAALSAYIVALQHTKSSMEQVERESESAH